MAISYQPEPSLDQLTAAWVSAVADATAAAEELSVARREETAASNRKNREDIAERDAFEALLTYRMKHRLTPTRTADQPVRTGPTDLREIVVPDGRLADRIHDSR